MVPGRAEGIKAPLGALYQALWRRPALQFSVMILSGLPPTRPRPTGTTSSSSLESCGRPRVWHAAGLKNCLPSEQAGSLGKAGGGGSWRAERQDLSWGSRWSGLEEIPISKS